MSTGMQHFVRGEGRLAFPAQQASQPANDRRRLASNAKIPVPGTPRKGPTAPAPPSNPAFGAPPAFTFAKPIRPTSALAQARNSIGQNEKGKHTVRPGRDAYETDAESLDTTVHDARSAAQSVVQVKDSQAPEYTQQYSDDPEEPESDDEGEHQGNQEGNVEDSQDRITRHEPVPSKTLHFLDRRLLDNTELDSYPTTTSGRMEDEDAHGGDASSEPELDQVPSPSPKKQRRRFARSQVEEGHNAQQARQPINLPVHPAVSASQLPEVGASRSRSFPTLATQGSDRPRTQASTQAQLQVSDQSRQQAAALRANNKPQHQHPTQPVARPKSAGGRSNHQALQATPQSEMPPPPIYGLNSTQPPAYSHTPKAGQGLDLDTPAQELFTHATHAHQPKAQFAKPTVTAQSQGQRESTPAEETNYEDYDRPALFEMEYKKLKNESFDTIPRGIPLPLSDEMKNASLEERLDFVQQRLSTEDQNKFFGSISTREWEEAGDWFLGRFGNIVKRMTEVRKEKRKRAMEFENEIEKRHEHVAKMHKTVEDAMEKMRNKGQTLLPRSPRRD
ncbi:uncharacterized protein BDZ99DRAFT_540123 [Mytilinidion resinicola]|uniref:Extracellular mutant protein 11 C-terminal domain-containing protein n=1 Tax=Mytilinidion resinicola TaxID=574789 RepID=A0A6A6Y9V4_9PEZI|nr:uncharacterized protein BDZ99DRAFT_540123 [Mytilinidion resinicola]KAF2805596.1 hypothetical protein BDZ99DRAFT_540123 [Mytilinidion resinicola]